MAGLRILLYANVDAAEAGGVQAVVRGLRAHLAARSHRVTTGWAERSTPDGGDADGWVEAFHPRRKGRRWLNLPALARLAVRLLRERPQVINIHFASPSARHFIALAPWLGFRVVVTCHGSDILRPLAHDAPHLAPLIADADAVTVVSQDIAARLAELGIAPARAPVVIANGVDTDFWQPAPHLGDASRAAASAPGHVVAIGRLEPVKGFDLLIEAAALLAARGVGLRLTIVGEGSEHAALAARAARLGIAERVAFAGRLAPPAVRDLLRAADLFALPSRSEGMPLALMEAMACGLPVVAADVGGVARTAGGAAVLVPPENPQALADGIAGLLGEGSKGTRSALGEQARARALDYSVKAGHAAYEALLTDLAARRRA